MPAPRVRGQLHQLSGALPDSRAPKRELIPQIDVTVKLFAEVETRTCLPVKITRAQPPSRATVLFARPRSVTSIYVVLVSEHIIQSPQSSQWARRGPQTIDGILAAEQPGSGHQCRAQIETCWRRSVLIQRALPRTERKIWGEGESAALTSIIQIVGHTPRSEKQNTKFAEHVVNNDGDHANDGMQCQLSTSLATERSTHVAVVDWQTDWFQSKTMVFAMVWTARHWAPLHSQLGTRTLPCRARCWNHRWCRRRRVSRGRNVPVFQLDCAPCPRHCNHKRGHELYNWVDKLRQWQWHTQRSLSNNRWWPGLTGVSEGVMSEEKYVKAGVACSVGKVCTYTLLMTVCSTSNTREKNTKGWNKHRVLLEYHLGGNNYSFDALQAYCFGINIKL